VARVTRASPAALALAALALAALAATACASPAARENPGPADTVALTVPAPAAVAAGDSLPVVDVSGRAVIAVWAVPSDSLLNADDGLASLADDYMYYLADSRPRLDSLGIANLHQPLAWADRRLRVRSGAQSWVVSLPDSVPVGYVFAAPGRAPRVHAGLLVDEELADSARALLPP
jgi:hypothetical protein